MSALSEVQQQAVARGEPVRACLNGREIVLLRADVLRRIQRILDAERAVIEAGHTRQRIEVPARLEALAPPSEDLGPVALLPGDRYEEVRELVADDRLRSSWTKVIAAAQRKSSSE